MCRPLGAVSVLLLLFIGTSGRNILQDSGATEPTSFAAKKNANSEAVTSADAATQQALQNQKIIQLQGKQTQVKSHSTQKKTLQQVRRNANNTVLVRPCPFNVCRTFPLENFELAFAKLTERHYILVTVVWRPVSRPTHDLASSVWYRR